MACICLLCHPTCSADECRFERGALEAGHVDGIVFTSSAEVGLVAVALVVAPAPLHRCECKCMTFVALEGRAMAPGASWITDIVGL